MELDKAKITERLLTRLFISGNKDCWIYVGENGKTRRYPRLFLDGKYYRVAALILWICGFTDEPVDCMTGYSAISKRSDLLCHTCDNGKNGCVRPSHIFCGTQRENMQDCLEKGRNPFAARNLCVNGHNLNDPLIGRRYKGKPNQRHCLECKRESDRRLNQRSPEKYKGPLLLKMAITKEDIQKAFEATGGNQREALKILGISDSNLNLKSKRFRLKLSWIRPGREPYKHTITHCQRGHPFNRDNTYNYSNGRRGCKTCLRMWRQKRDQPRILARQRWNEIAAEAIPLALVIGGGNNTRACEAVGLSRTTFERKRRELNIQPAVNVRLNEAVARLKELRKEILNCQVEWRKLASA